MKATDGLTSMASCATFQPLANAARWRARTTLALFAMMLAFFVAVTLSPLKSGFADAPNRGPGDVELYHAEVNRIRAGESYYDAAASELRARGYPTRSIFNWRMPLPVRLVALVPDARLAMALLAALSLVLVWASFALLVNEAGLRTALLPVVLLSGAILPCLLDNLVVMSELWSGVLIALSAALFGIRRPAEGVVAGIAALVFRELAAPYVLVCLALALHERRYRELACWGVGLAAYAVYLAAHVYQVLPRAGGEGLAQVGSWIRFGGAGFLISALQMNAYLLLLPQWVTGIYLACVLLGCATWNTPAGCRVGLTIASYAIAFSIAGNDYNQYWGSLVAPLAALAACRAPAALGGLIRSAAPRGAGWLPWLDLAGR